MSGRQQREAVGPTVKYCHYIWGGCASGTAVGGAIRYMYNLGTRSHLVQNTAKCSKNLKMKLNSVPNVDQFY